jgi:L-rhamnose mutarotase
MMRRYYLALDLKSDPQLIAEYRRYHQKIWPEIAASMKDAGVVDAEIYLAGTRMVMVLEVNDHFSLDRKARMDRDNPKVQEWERLMWKFQQALPQAKNGEKWMLMERIFKLEE